MDPQHFPEETGTYAKGQPQYRTLPVNVTKIEKNPDLGFVVNNYTCKYGITDFEIEQLKITRSFFISQTGSCLHPILPRVDNPFQNHFIIKYRELGEGFYEAYVPLTDGRTYTIERETPREIINQITHHFPECKAENLIFMEAPTLAIAEDGSIKEL
jgi:hypothetical protein